MSEPRVVVIGYGFAGRCFHSYLVSITPGLVLQGVASRNAEKRERIVKERGCRAYASFEEVIGDPEVDLVVLATPNGTHCDLAVRALEAGKHVVTDKVAALNLAEFDRMTGAAARGGKLLSVFQNRRWDGDFLTLKQLIKDGKLGEVRWIEMAWQGFGAWGGWRGDAAQGGGKLYDLGAHMIDQLVLLFPQAVQSVYCRMHHDFKDKTAESQALVVIGFEGGATGVCDTSSLAAISKPRFHAFGTGGTFIKYGLDPQEAAMIKGDIDAARHGLGSFGRLHDGKEEMVVTTAAGRWRSYYENIRDVLEHGAPEAVRLSEVRRAIGVIEAAFESARTGKVVEMKLAGVPPLEGKDREVFGVEGKGEVSGVRSLPPTRRDYTPPSPTPPERGEEAFSQGLSGPPALPRVGTQLSVFRPKYNFGKDGDLVLDCVRDAGYAGVEGGSGNAAEWRRKLDERGLVGVGTHTGYNGLEDLKGLIQYCKTLGGRDLCNSALPGWPDCRLEDYKTAIATLNRVGRQLRDEGIQLHYHNHDVEFRKVDGEKTGMDLLLDGLDFEVVDLCVDVAWVLRGGSNPATFLRQHKERIGYLHIKDYDGTHWAELGRGLVDLREIVKVLPELKKVKWAMIEQDSTRIEPLDSARISREYLREEFGW